MLVINQSRWSEKIDRTSQVLLSISIQLGSATVLIGDPSGRLQERKQALSNDEIVENTQNIERLIRSIFDNHQKYFYKDSQKKLLPLM